MSAILGLSPVMVPDPAHFRHLANRDGSACLPAQCARLSTVDLGLHATFDHLF